MAGTPTPRIESHPQKNRIIDALIAGESPKSIAAWCNPSLDHTTIWRYRRKHFANAVDRAIASAKLLKTEDVSTEIAPTVVERQIVADATKADLGADPFVSRILRKYSNYEALQRYAVKKKDLKGFAAVDRAETSTMTLHAQLTGRLQQQGPSVAVQIVFAGDAQQKPANLPSIDVDVIDLNSNNGK